MANFTKKAILDTFEEMLTELPLDKITVSALVARCGISSNTFYYHFHDLYDLLDAWLLDKQAKHVKRLHPGGSWEDALKAILHEMQDNPKIILHVFNPVSRERLERYIFNSGEKPFLAMVKSMTRGKKIPEEDLVSVAGFCRDSFLGFLIRFVWGNMEADVDKEVDNISALFRACAEKAAEKRG